MKHGRVTELPEDFWIPSPLDTDNITSLSPFLVPQDHLASSGTYYAMAIYMLFIFIVGSFINALTIACTMQNKKLRSHLNYILVNLAISNLLVSGVGSFTAFCTFACRYFILGPLACKIEGFIVTLGVYNPVIYVLLNKQFRSCMMKMLGMGGADDEESSTSSVTEVSKVGPA